VGIIVTIPEVLLDTQDSFVIRLPVEGTLKDVLLYLILMKSVLKGVRVCSSVTEVELLMCGSTLLLLRQCVKARVWHNTKKNILKYQSGRSRHIGMVYKRLEGL
jgi:hypothetical protein